ncbi:MAG: hypothetical protein H0W70_06505, partial [Actinobacteria bacterium]|nr:hypothetical protein [Actinomycetota bacterium]
LIRRYRQIGAVYEHLGIFSDLRQATGRGLLTQGLRTAGAVSPSGSAGGRRRRAGIAALKAAAVACGRLESRLGRRLPRG